MRLQLALNVDNIDDAVEFHTKLFGVAPLKRKPGYANFAIEQPPLKLVLFEKPGDGGSVNHLGVEVETAEEVTDAHARLTDAGLAPTPIDTTTCCWADKVETWITDTDGARWEYYVKQADAEEYGHDSNVAPSTEAACC